jgi:methionyl-tRNA formyltransferase
VTPSARIAFLGNDAWSVPSLTALAESFEVVLVVTANPKPAGRGNRPTRTPVAIVADGRSLPLAEVETARAGPGFERLSAAAPDVLAVVAYGELLPADVLALPALAPVNLHFSLLPALRGASPVQSALRLGLDRTGVTTIVMDAGLDTGPIVLQREEEIRPQDDAGTLGERLARAGAGVLVESVDLIVSGRAAPRPQNDAAATYAPRLGPEDRRLDWSIPASSLVNLCRALSPEPAATTRFRGRPLKVHRAEVAEADGEPGRIVSVTRTGIVVATSRGGLRPLDVAPAGRRRMSGGDFVNGLRPEVGERLG